MTTTTATTITGAQIDDAAEWLLNVRFRIVRAETERGETYQRYQKDECDTDEMMEASQNVALLEAERKGGLDALQRVSGIHGVAQITAAADMRQFS